MNRVGTIATLALMTIAVLACQDRGESETSSRNDSDGRRNAALVQDYLDVADTVAETTPITDEFIADSMRKLAAALGTLNLGDLDLQVALRVAAEHVVSNPQPVGTSAAVRNALISAAEAIEADGTGGGGLRQSAESVLPDRPLADQAAAIREFLRRSGPALRRVSRPTP